MSLEAFALGGPVGDAERHASCIDTRTNTSSLDYLILSSDSGRLSILEFEMNPTPHFVSLYQETYGKTGARRMVPGQWLAADPKGRSVMVGS
jgi:hypothetical protein